MPLVTPRRRRPLDALKRCLACALGFVVLTVAADAQVLRGSVRTLDSSLPVPNAEIVLRDSVGAEIARAVSDVNGLFIITMRSRSAFSLHARRLGFQMASTDLMRVAEDTVNLEIQLAEVALEAEAVTVTGIAALNAARLEEAERRGWNVYAPELIAQHRERAPDLIQLLRSLGPRNLQMPRSPRDCVRSMRTNQCVTYVVDGQVLGTEAYILPSDVYFLAVLTPSESQVMYGSRALNGAVVVYTRMDGDRYDRNSLPPHLRLPEPERRRPPNTGSTAPSSATRPPAATTP